MDRLYSAQLEHGLTPWSNDEELQVDILGKNDFKIITKSPVKLKTDMLNQAQINKFHKLMEQHRERLRGKKMSNTRSLQIMEKDRKIKIQYTSQKNNQLEKSNTELLQQDPRDYRRNNTLSSLSRLGQFLPTKIKSFHPLIKDSMQHERDIIKTFYRTKTANRNADKFYGALNKKLDIMRPQVSGTALQNKNQLALKSQARKMNSSIINTTNPVKQIVQIKLTKYRSYRTIEKLNFEAKKYKKMSQKDSKEHVLDRILVSL